MQWKLATIKRLNRMLKPFSLHLRRLTGYPSLDEQFRMLPALRRVRMHAVQIGSIFDLGGSDGRWSLAVRSVFPDARFLAVEPLAEQQPALEATKAQWPAFEFALCAAGEPGCSTAVLNVSEDLVRSTMGGGGKARTVPVKTLDALATEHKLAGPFLIKFDTHGYELPILRGAERVLRETSVIVMEMYNFDLTAHSRRFPQMCQHLEDLGFRCCDLADPMLREHDRAFWQMDMLFMRKDHDLFRHCAYE